ncbi:MAG TPA: hypothetical protein VH255_08365 [Verrucomicrobiae bacterium]|jgi:hypothetical protein|nr:hypothetical protein [Verrucomicrobiae bacterium]
MKSTKASRFVCLGIPGLILFLYGYGGVFALADGFHSASGSFNFISLFLMVVAGLILLLSGIGKLKQWGYAGIFLSIPVLFFVFLALSKSVILSAFLTFVSAAVFAQVLRYIYKQSK